MGVFSGGSRSAEAGEIAVSVNAGTSVPTSTVASAARRARPRRGRAGLADLTVTTGSS